LIELALACADDNCRYDSLDLRPEHSDSIAVTMWKCKNASRDVDEDCHFSVNEQVRMDSQRRVQIRQTQRRILQQAVEA